VAEALREELSALMSRRPDRSHATRFDRVLEVTVDRERARFGAWYEMFPRSTGPDPSRSATFDEAQNMLPYVASMGFDVLYLPPIHPIGRAFRKGPNNSLTPGVDDPGSPWAIGSEDGGHTAVEPGLGTIEDFDRFVAAADRHGLEIALDIAFQASPDHPYVREHPEWFRHRPDGTIKYAENPPKKYPGHLPDQLRVGGLAGALAGTEGRVRVLDRAPGQDLSRRQPAHQAIPLLGVGARRAQTRAPGCDFSVRGVYPTESHALSREVRLYTVVLLLHVAQYESGAHGVLHRAGADRRPRVHAPEPVCEHPRHSARLLAARRPSCVPGALVLAATLGASYGIYSGFELAENVPVRDGSEEYLDSEKYQIRHRDYRQAAASPR
jgi:starch synthase (maltosyl-transferring)